MEDSIVQEGAPVLRRKAKTLTKAEIASPKTRKLVAHMQRILAAEEYGVALAAPQIGEPLRIFVVAGRVFEKPDGDEAANKEPEDMVFINPEMLRLSRKKMLMEEGCLSVRRKYGTVMRHEKATVRALRPDGTPFTYHGTGLAAHIFQHELDHLEGILYTDKATAIEEDEDLASAKQKLRDRAH
jgi:peptide deformylase